MMKEITKETIATAECEVRVEGYQARLDLYYYKVEYDEEPLDLLGIERSIATAVASSLSDCDENMKPIYAVELSAVGHKRSDTGK
jgi:5-formaminoimidazole-4-carboxamide-1-beta-D-ribofuranosyl 5'-monophosphate synthetase